MGLQEGRASISCRPWLAGGLGWFVVFHVVSTVTSPAQTEFEEPWGVKRLVEFHQARHAGLEVQDVYKLLYQSCFGVEHLLTDSTEVTAFLQTELASTDSPMAGEPILERISSENDYVRVNLRPFKSLNLKPDLLVQTMFRSAEETIPDTAAFYRLWNEFAALIRYGLLRFPPDDLTPWDERVGANRFEPVHHSSGYTSANRPSYRVVKRSVFDELFGRKI
jgi:hypothetical protein